MFVRADVRRPRPPGPRADARGFRPRTNPRTTKRRTGGFKQQVDLVVHGSVAVNACGARLAEDAGYSDVEMALQAEAGFVSERTTIATTVHDLQALEEELPEQWHDFRVDLIATPIRTLTCSSPRRPTGLLWRELTTEQIDAIPVLEARVNRSVS